jgi:hypothetical protein
MRRLWILLLAVLFFGALSHADTYSAFMTGTSEVPANGSPATGIALVTITGNFLTIEVHWTGLIGGVPAAAHIHCCTPPGSNVGVAVGFPGFPATVSGNYSHLFDLTDLSIYTASFVNNFGGGTAAGAEAALIAGLDAGDAYVNIHNATFPSGEIRGLLSPDAVPEPSSFMLLGSGLAGFAGIIRRKLTK